MFFTFYFMDLFSPDGCNNFCPAEDAPTVCNGRLLRLYVQLPGHALSWSTPEATHGLLFPETFCKSVKVYVIAFDELLSTFEMT